MTTIALLNLPRCLDQTVFCLPAPRAVPESVSRWRSGWDALGTQGGTQAFRDAAARECLDTVAALRVYREPLPDEVWTLPLASERRMLAQVNAIVALGSRALHRVVDEAIDSDLPDPGRVFAALLVLGCVAGSAWQQPMLRIFVAAVDRHPAEGAAAVEALSLAPNLEVLTGLATLLNDNRPRRRAAAIQVLAFRAALTQSAWAAAMRDDDDAVVTAAACAPLGGFERQACAEAVELLLSHASERAVCAALRAGVGLRLWAAYRRAGELARSSPQWADALQYLSMFGFHTDEDVIRAALGGPQPAMAVRAAGLLGRVALVPDLLALGAQGELAPAERDAIGEALATITGLPMGTTYDAAAADLLWAHNQDRFDPRQRYRHGLRFHPAVLLDLLQPPVAAAIGTRLHRREVRQQTYLELVMATQGRVPRFSAYDFVASQVAALQHIAQWVAGSVSAHWTSAPLD